MYQITCSHQNNTLIPINFNVVIKSRLAQLQDLFNKRHGRRFVIHQRTLKNIPVYFYLQKVHIYCIVLTDSCQTEFRQDR